MQENRSAFPGKLLLFGEHVVVQGAQALAVPLPELHAAWEFSADAAAEGNAAFYEWADYLETVQEAGNLGSRLDLDRFRKDIGNGLVFRSNIPKGYGVGSSGALCAALYARYASAPLPATEESAYPELKFILGKIESFFHGSSSGADPLVSYVDRPLLFDHGGIVRQVKLKGAGAHFFLLDTGKPRQTGPLVRAFQQWCANEFFHSSVLAELVPATENAIQCLISGDLVQLVEEFRRISYFQYRYMQEFIQPSSWQEIWLDALSDEVHALKLCGAGGGGFVLGLSRDVGVTRTRYAGRMPLFLSI